MERTRCMHCRNPIKPHQVAVRPAADEAYHEDCWPAAQSGVTVGVAEVSGVQLQLDYERRIATEGLVGLLSPYVMVLPGQRERVAAPIAQLVEQMAAAAATAAATPGPAAAVDDEEVSARS